MTRKQDTSSRALILEAAEELMARRGFHAVTMREIAREAGVNLGSVTYHFGTKENLLQEIYDRHTQPMNQRRIELLEEAERISDRGERLSAVIRAFVVPAFSSSADAAGGGERFTRLRAIVSMEGNEVAGRIIAAAFDDTTRAFIEAIGRCLPQAGEAHIAWRSQFLLGGLYYTLVTGERLNRITDGRVDGSDRRRAIDELVRATTASLLAMPDAEHAKEDDDSATPVNVAKL
ncbi:MAG: TetR/AcrR family transcriptional regulator [Proteobacteria bacterium]|nr:MAG: TetR/AcrR family transcriptional regulator [Pseudomonadota bacterium]